MNSPWIMINLNELNPDQKLAASKIEGPVLILAGAGSGKTRTITYRMAHMIGNLKIPATSILAVSFTNKAAQEMGDRVKKLLGRKLMKGINLGTFHSLGTRILRKELHLLGYHPNFTIYDTSDQMSLIREALQHNKGEKSFDRKKILAKIGFLKNKAIAAEEFVKSPYFDPDDDYDLITELVFNYYQDKLKFFNAIDFDDLLYLTVKIFDQFPEVAEKYSQQFKYIMVDEYQDTNPLQFKLILHLTKTHQNLCVVGDDDQSIYSFRGADISNILDFEKFFQNATTVKLEQNYRSTSAILDLANSVIKENIQRKDKTMWTKNISQELPALWMCADTDHEAQVVADEIHQLQKRGTPLSQVGILIRSNTQAAPFEEALRLHNIPYTIIGGQKFYEKKEIKDIIAYLQVIKNPYDEISLRRILNIPQRGIGTTTLNRFLQKASENKISLFAALERFFYLDPKREQHILSFIQLIKTLQENFQTLPLHEGIRSLINQIDFYSFIEKNYESSVHQVTRRKLDVEYFIQSAERFTQYYQKKDMLKSFLERILLQDNQDKEKDMLNPGEENKKNEATILTLHSSKGLEYEHIFLVGIEEESLPHKRSIAEGNLHEERRLCYVGLTRAKQKLIMTYCKERTLYGKKIPRHKSRFIIPYAHQFTEVDRTTFSHLSLDEHHEYQNNFFGDLLSSLE